jgi:ATP-dependent helicase/nuclease subunit A
VTTRSKSPDAFPAGAFDASRADPEELKVLSRPKFLSIETTLTATERGTATHLVLQHLDLGRRCDATDIENQINDLIERHVLSPVEAATVDRGAIVWFTGTDLGRSMRKNVSSLRREVPVYFSAEPDLPTGAIASLDPLDRIMVRGRLDVVMTLPAESLIVDYKTDAVGADSLPARVDFYRPQMQAYRKAFAAISRRPVAHVYLVFLAAREVVEV